VSVLHTIFVRRTLIELIYIGDTKILRLENGLELYLSVVLMKFALHTNSGAFQCPINVPTKVKTVCHNNWTAQRLVDRSFKWMAHVQDNNF